MNSLYSSERNGDASDSGQAGSWLSFRTLAPLLGWPVRRRKRLLHPQAWVGLLASVASLALGHFIPPGLNTALHHGLFALRGERSWDERLVLIKIDQASVDVEGWLPWERDRYGALLDVLTEAGSNVVAFDLLFSEPAALDPVFAAAMQRHGQVVLSGAWSYDGTPLAANDQLAQEALAIGHITQLAPRRDGYPEVHPLILGTPALAIATLQAYALIQDVPLLLLSEGRSSDPSLSELSTSPPTLLVNWPAAQERLTQYSFRDVVAGRVELEQFENKIVLIGATLPGLDDLSMPFKGGDQASGVHLHAALIQNLLQQKTLRAPLLSGPNLLWLLGAGLLLGCGVKRWAKPGWFLTVVALAWLVLCWFALAIFDLLLPMLVPLGAIFLTGLGTLLLEQQQLRVLNRRLTAQAITDPLTQLKNRRFLEDALALLWEKLSRESTEISLVICDVDYFKRYNDTYGHPAGDRCLQLVAQAIEQALSANLSHSESLNFARSAHSEAIDVDPFVLPADCFVARYGGEEFVMVLPKTPVAIAIRYVERVQANLTQLQLPHRASPLGRVTLSLGVAWAIADDSFTPQALLSQADQLLYAAKQKGRNDYCVARDR